MRKIIVLILFSTTFSLFSEEEKLNTISYNLLDPVFMFSGMPIVQIQYQRKLNDYISASLTPTFSFSYYTDIYGIEFGMVWYPFGKSFFTEFYVSKTIMKSYDEDDGNSSFSNMSTFGLKTGLKYNIGNSFIFKFGLSTSPAFEMPYLIYLAFIDVGIVF